MQYPFVVNQQSQPVNIKAVYDEVSATLQPPGGQHTSFDFLGLFLDVTNLASAVAFQAGFDDAGVSLGLIAAGGQFAADSISQPDGDSTDTSAAPSTNSTNNSPTRNSRLSKRLTSSEPS